MDLWVDVYTEIKACLIYIGDSDCVLLTWQVGLRKFGDVSSANHVRLDMCHTNYRARDGQATDKTSVRLIHIIRKWGSSIPTNTRYTSIHRNVM